MDEIINIASTIQFSSNIRYNILLANLYNKNLNNARVIIEEEISNRENSDPELKKLIALDTIITDLVLGDDFDQGGVRIGDQDGPDFI